MRAVARATGASRAVLAAVAVMIGAAAAGAHGGTVIVVLSNNAAPYLQAEQAIAESLAKRGHAVQLLGLEDATAPALLKLVESGLGAFIAVGGEAAVTLRRRLPGDVPLSYCMVADAEGLDLTPSRNAFGVSAEAPLEDQIALIREALPSVRTLGMLYRSKTPRSLRLRDSVSEALPAGWRLQAVDVDASHSIAQAIETLLSRNVDIIWTAADSSVYDAAAVRSLLLSAMRRRVPVFGFSPAFVRAGALFGVGVDPASQGRQAADIAHGLLEESKTPSEVHTPRYQVAVNLTVADILSIELPRKLILRAEHVIQTE